MIDHNKLHAVLLMASQNQDTLNQSLHPQWYEQGYPYYRAVWTELAEAIQHTNWLWWKASEYGKPESPAQIADIHIEMCDIFHFGMSMDIIGAKQLQNVDAGVEYNCRQYAQWFQFEHLGKLDFYEAIEQVVVGAIWQKRFDIEHFARACLSVGLTLPRLLVLYFGKATLNKFRWDNGYKLPKDDPKKYKKMWPEMDGGTGTVEDNVYLSHILKRLLATNTEENLLNSMADGEFQTGVYNRLAFWYSNMV